MIKYKRIGVDKMIEFEQYKFQIEELKELAKEYEGKANIGKVDVDENDDITARYGIRNIPTILFFKNGELVDKQVGAATKAAIAAKIDALL